MVSERIQAGDVMLLKFLCPKCSSQEFQAYPQGLCSHCKSDLSSYALSIDRCHRRLLSGTRRKKGRISARIVKELLNTYGKNCAYCGIYTGDAYHLEHITPLAVGGTNNIGNLCIACPRCNLCSGAKAFTSFDNKRNYILHRRAKELETHR